MSTKVGRLILEHSKTLYQINVLPAVLIMKKSIVIYSLAVGITAFLLQWLEYKYTVRVFSIEIYIVLIAILFTGLGVWIGKRLTTSSKKRPFEKNVRALAYLGISEREYDVLMLLAEGLSNKEIAQRLFVSPNTVKTHLARLYEKLEVSRRTQAINKAKDLHIIP